MAGLDYSMDVCEWVTTHHADLVRKLWRQTDERGLEHGSVAWVEDNRPARYSPVVGRESSIDVRQPPEESRPGRVNIHLHTHPSNNVGLSAADWKHLSSVLQFPPERADWIGQETVRGTAIISQRLDEDAITIRGVTGTPEHTRLSISEQQQVYSDFASVVSEADPFKRAIKATAELEGLITTCTTQVQP